MFFFRETIEEKKNREYCVLKQYSRTGQGGGSTPTVYEAHLRCMKHLPAADMKRSFLLFFTKKKTAAKATVFGFVSGGGRWTH